MANKIITDDILKKATEGVIQTIADNIFEFESYNDTEIAELFSLTPEEAKSLTELINDEVISKYKLWSSKKVSDELLNAQNECNDYTDDRLSGISSISLKYCEELPDVGESNCIYILKSTDSNPDTLNLYDSDNAIWTSIGDFNISLDEYYKKSEVDTKLDLKADKTEILAQDDVITDTSLATTSNVLSATTTIDELDKKANDDEVVKKTDITTTIDSTSTDTQVPSAKAVYDNAIKDKNSKTYTDISQLGLTAGHTVQDVYMAMDEGSIAMISVVDGSCADTPDTYGILVIEKQSVGRVNIVFKQSHNVSIAPNYMWMGTLKGIDGTGLTWKRVCTTSVDDVSETSIEFDETALGLTIVNSHSLYKVINGICYVTIEINVVPPTENKIYGYTKISTTSIPKIGFSTKATLNVVESNSSISAVLDRGDTIIKLHGNILAREGSCIIQGSFSYPVAES